MNALCFLEAVKIDKSRGRRLGLFGMAQLIAGGCPH